MSLNNFNRIVTNGLVMALDAANLKSFPGEPTTNIINSVTDSYPRVGNAWGTYNTNQYNNNTYFSIGTVTGVSNNEVTTAAAHPLRTYDVVTPQTSGGGLTAGTNYYIKKTGSTTFTVHAYDATQDGSKGFEVLRPIRNDTRVSINATSFPTMWWGPPHLPNSGLIKTIIPGAFNGHECIRLNWYRPDGVVDGMAYGVTPTVTSGVSYTYSWYHRAANATAESGYAYTTIYYAGNASSATIGTYYPKSSKWQRFSATLTAPATGVIYLYWWPSAGSMAVDISEIQIEAKTYATNFTPASRSTTNCLLDLSGNSNHGTFVNGPIFNSPNGGSVYFDGADDYITITNTATLRPATEMTVMMWIKATSITSGWNNIFGQNPYTGGYLIFLETGGTLIRALHYVGGVEYRCNTNQAISTSVYTHVCFTFKTGDAIRSYFNGAVSTTVSLPDGTFTYNTSNAFNLGYVGGSWFNGNIASVNVYNRALSASEVQQNFNATRKRFGV